MTVDTTTGEVQPAAPLDELAAALAAFQAEMPIVPKAHTATVKSDKGQFSYTYAGLADVTEAAAPLLAKHGLAFTALPGNGVLVGMLLHTSGQALTASLPIHGNTPQQIGSSLTYMRRYLLGCMTGIVTDDDDDGQAAQATPKKRAAKPAPEAGPVRMSRPAYGGVTEGQIAKMGAQMSELNLKDRDLALAYVADVIGRPVASRNDLTTTEASQVIDALQRDLDAHAELTKARNTPEPGPT